MRQCKTQVLVRYSRVNYVGDLIESMITWHRKPKSKSWGWLSVVLNMTPSKHDRTDNTINGSIRMVLNILIIFFLLPKYFNLVITYIKLLHSSLVGYLGRWTSPLHCIPYIPILITWWVPIGNAYSQPNLMKIAPLKSPGSRGLARTQKMHAHVLVYGCTNSTKIIKQGLDENNSKDQEYESHSTGLYLGVRLLHESQGDNKTRNKNWLN